MNIGVAINQAAQRRVVTGPGFSVRFDAEALGRDLNEIGKKQLPFALALSLNRTMEESQQAVYDRMFFMAGLSIRSDASGRWLMRQIKFFRGDRATKEKLEAVLTVNPGAGAGDAETGSFRGRSILAFLEEGGQRLGKRPIGNGMTFGPSVAVPLRKSKYDTVPKSLYPVNLGLEPRRRIEGGLTAGQLRGARRTFAIRTGPNRGMVLQRFGRGQRDTRVLFFIRPSVNVKGRRFIVPTVNRTFTERMPVNFASFFQYAIDTAKTASNPNPATPGQGVRLRDVMPDKV